MSNQLKPCPLCESYDVEVNHGKLNGNIYAAQAYCKSCISCTELALVDLCIPFAVYHAIDGAIEKWNTRAKEDV